MNAKAPNIQIFGNCRLYFHAISESLSDLTEIQRTLRCTGCLLLCLLLNLPGIKQNVRDHLFIKDSS